MLCPRYGFWSCSVLGVLFAFGVSNARADDISYYDLVLQDSPVAYWRWERDGADSASSDNIADLAAKPNGQVHTAHPGPQPPVFPYFQADNRAIEIPRGGGYLRVSDPGEKSPLDFDAGDSITLEAWVAPQSAPKGAYVYIVGKGRTGAAAVNQNYALRLHGRGDSAAVTFLFRSRGEEGDWHRWTSNTAFPLGDGWHYVAVTYTFGQKDSLKGYLDGELVAGKWDMGGATDRAPVVGDDELWIGSSMGGQANSTFHGGIDEVAIYRTALSPERIRARFKYVATMPEVDSSKIPEDGVLVEIFEGVHDKKSWDFRPPRFAERYVAPAFAFPATPNKYTATGVLDDRSNPYLLRASGSITIPAGKHRLLARGRNSVRVHLDGQTILETPFFNIPNNGHGKVTELDASQAPSIRALRRGDQQAIVEVEGDDRPHLVQMETIVGGQTRRPELGDTSLSIAPPEGEFALVSPTLSIPFTEEGWRSYVASQQEWLTAWNAQRRREASIEETKYWEWRHELARREVARSPAPKTPESSPGYPANNEIDRFINVSLAARGEELAPLTDDLAFLRRVSLDVIGLIPTPEEIEVFLADPADARRARAIDRLLNDPSWSDHWTSYWQDVLAENPNIVNPTLNNTGPFRWWLYESFSDNKPLDRMVTELVMMEGSVYFGGPAGFALATENDAPMAAKGHILGKAFLGLEMSCARCHDAPFHRFKQQDLFSVAAMLMRAPQAVPKTSSVPAADSGRTFLVNVTLAPGAEVRPEWPFSDLSPNELSEGVLRRPGDSRERLAALITSHKNDRFAQVIVNRLWRRYLGRGLVEPVDDWEHAAPSHPELLDWLAREFVTHGYDLKQVARLVLSSHAYQRRPVGRDRIDATQPYLFAAPVQRRMTAEQLVDSLFRACGKPFDAGPMNVDIDSSRSYKQSLNLGAPTRSWMFASLSNERDRPSLSLPYAQPFVEVLETFGWRGSRQDPVSVRPAEPTPPQPAILANGVLGRRITRLSDDSAFTALALEDQPLEHLIERACLQVLSRPPTTEEYAAFVELLKPGYDERRIETPASAPALSLAREMVGWSNHLDPQANVLKLDLEKTVRAGDAPTARLAADWRERMEDMVWTLVNSPEFVFTP
jgi:hypothetical protein